MENKARILVIGASGFCGRGVLNELSGDERYSLWAHVRPESNSRDSLTELCSELQHQILPCSMDELPQHIQEIQPTVISSFIGTTQKKMKPLGLTYEDVDYGINHELALSGLKLENPPLFVYVSSMGIEWSRWSSYLKAREMVESMLEESGLPHVILRPGILSGPTRTESRPMEHIGAVVSGGMANAMKAIGWQQKSDEMMPLTASKMGRAVQLLVKEWMTGGSSKDYSKTILVHEIHALLRDSL